MDFDPLLITEPVCNEEFTGCSLFTGFLATGMFTWGDRKYVQGLNWGIFLLHENYQLILMLMLFTVGIYVCICIHVYI